MSCVLHISSRKLRQNHVLKYALMHITLHAYNVGVLSGNVLDNSKKNAHEFAAKH